MQVSILDTVVQDWTRSVDIKDRFRRVKCGEEKPFCIRCASTGRQCEGYLPVSRTQRQTVELRPYQGNITTLRVRNINIGANDQERRGFQFFCEKYVIERMEDLGILWADSACPQNHARDIRLFPIKLLEQVGIAGNTSRSSSIACGNCLELNPWNERIPFSRKGGRIHQNTLCPHAKHESHETLSPAISRRTSFHRGCVDLLYPLFLSWILPKESSCRSLPSGLGNQNYQLLPERIQRQTPITQCQDPPTWWGIIKGDFDPCFCKTGYLSFDLCWYETSAIWSTL